MKYYLIAGEASGDLHAGNLMRELAAIDSEAEFRFIGGENMQKVGGTMIRHYKDLAYMGFIPVLMHLRTIFSNMRQCKADIMKWRPDVVILIDYPGFNLNIANYIHQQKESGALIGTNGKPTQIFYYISPKIWAWKEYRIKAMRRDIDELFSILPFEVEWFAERNMNIHYVGNPCVDAIQHFNDSDNTPDSAPSTPYIAIVAGSRKQEIKDNLGMMLKSATAFPDYSLIIAGAPNIEPSYYQRYIPKGTKAEVRFGETYNIVKHATAALVTSGTATLETAILRTPQVVCYYTPVGKIISFLRRHILKVPFISLVNLVAGKEIVRELVADTMTLDNIKHELASILPGGKAREQMLLDYEEMNRTLGTAGASRRAAEQMYNLLK